MSHAYAHCDLHGKIDKDKVLEICENHYQHCLEMHDYCGESTVDNIKEDIEKLPTADVVKVVRCKDCEHYCIEAADGGKYCEILRYESPIESGYCCYGEARNGE